MYHIANLGSFAPRGIADIDGYVPEHGDDWRDMNYDLSGDDPDEEGISSEERDDRVSYLDGEWWPGVIRRASKATTEVCQSIGDWQED